MAAKRKTNTKKDLEDKIAELEAKLSKLSEQLDPPSATTTNDAPKRAFSQPRERKASKDTTQRPPRPCATSPPPRARPSGGRSAAIPPQHGRTRAGSKLPAGSQRGASHHRQPQKGAQRACDRPTVKSRLHFFPCLG